MFNITSIIEPAEDEIVRYERAIWRHSTLQKTHALATAIGMAGGIGAMLMFGNIHSAPIKSGMAKSPATELAAAHPATAGAPAPKL